jgi:hypothetical protein
MPSAESGFQPVFGRYLLLRRIGRGGMAEIFRAFRQGGHGSSMLVAVKRILPSLGLEARFVDMFINEAKLASLLDHANIVRILEFGCVDGRLYHALEYVHGVTVLDVIRALLAERRPVPVPLACLIFTEALYGLDRAHRQTDPQGRPLELIHRDLTPSNLLVSFEGDVKVADFGIAKATQYSVHTQSGYIKGKFRYMSPEQAQGRELDQRSDLFSLGVCFAELLTLRPMFAADGDLATLRKVRAADFTRPRELNPDIPPALEDCLLRALSREREGRHASAAEWLEELERVVFALGLKCFSSDLKAFMRSLFGPLIETRAQELAEEAERARALLGPLPSLGEADEPEVGTVHTLLMEAASLARAVQPSQADGPTRDLGPVERLDEEVELALDQCPTLRELPAVQEPQGRPTVLDLPAVEDPPDPDLGKRRTMQVPALRQPPPKPKP